MSNTRQSPKTQEFIGDPDRDLSGTYPGSSPVPRPAAPRSTTRVGTIGLIEMPRPGRHNYPDVHIPLIPIPEATRQLGLTALEAIRKGEVPFEDKSEPEPVADSSPKQETLF